MKIYSKETTPELKLKRANGTMKKIKILSSKDSYQFFKQIFDEETLEVCESFMVVFLNQANDTVGWFKVSQGGITGTVVDPRLIFQKAFECYATSMILAHNHPSGNLRPSQGDRDLTDKLSAGGKLLNIQVIDHVIITHDGYYSFADTGIL